MFTVCPKCALTLVVTAADLRIAQGYVRCGRCSSVFNALPHLTDERPPPLPQPELPPLTPIEAAPEAPAEEPAEEPHPEESGAELAAEEAPVPEDPDAVTGEIAVAVGAQVGEPDEEEAKLRDESLAQDLDATGEVAQILPSEEYPEDLSEAEEPAAPPGELPGLLPHESPGDATAQDASIHPVIPEEALEFDPSRADVGSVFIAAPPDPQWTAATGTFRQLIALKEEGSHAAGRAAPAAVPGVSTELPVADGAAAAAAPAPGVTLAAPLPPADADAAAALLGGESPAAPSFLARVPRNVWRIGAPLALGLLIVQMLNHNREALAADARFGHAVTALYGALGVRLVPAWDLHAYDVRQLGAQASPAGSGLITVHASIKNGAAQPQPLPLLRVTLQDRFGNRIAARDVAPRGYLPSAVATLSSLSAGQRIDAQMGFVDPGSNAVGFEIDACLPASAGGIACANDGAAR